jgi:hypothetical protein
VAAAVAAALVDAVEASTGEAVAVSLHCYVAAPAAAAVAAVWGCWVNNTPARLIALLGFPPTGAVSLYHEKKAFWGGGAVAPNGQTVIPTGFLHEI